MILFLKFFCDGHLLIGIACFREHMSNDSTFLGTVTALYLRNINFSNLAC